MRIDGYTRTCGVIGNPVEHTMSPVIHNCLANKQGENLAYVPFPVAEGRLEAAIRGAFALNLLGLNVTVPYKSQVIPYLVEIDPLAKRIGAVNTLVWQENGYKGYNTDMPGLYRALVKDGVKIAGEQVLILGAGGVARAVAVLLAQKGAAGIVILNRTIEHAKAIADEVNGFMGRELVAVCRLEEWTSLKEKMASARSMQEKSSQKYLAIQATNVGMYPHVEETLIEDPAFYRMIHTGYDLIFNPSKTRFMELTLEGGGRAFGGLGMLLYQGVIAYELWTGREVADELADEVYGKLKEAMGIQ